MLDGVANELGMFLVHLRQGSEASFVFHDISGSFKGAFELLVELIRRPVANIWCHVGRVIVVSDDVCLVAGVVWNLKGVEYSMGVCVPVQHIGGPCAGRGASIEYPSRVGIEIVERRECIVLRKKPGKGILGLEIKLSPNLNALLIAAVLKGRPFPL